MSYPFKSDRRRTRAAYARLIAYIALRSSKQARVFEGPGSTYDLGMWRDKPDATSLLRILYYTDVLDCDVPFST